MFNVQMDRQHQKTVLLFVIDVGKLYHLLYVYEYLLMKQKWKAIKPTLHNSWKLAFYIFFSVDYQVLLFFAFFHYFVGFLETV